MIWLIEKKHGNMKLIKTKKIIKIHLIIKINKMVKDILKIRNIHLNKRKNKKHSIPVKILKIKQVKEE
jgi:hypothetical protein